MSFHLLTLALAAALASPAQASPLSERDDAPLQLTFFSDDSCTTAKAGWNRGDTPPGVYAVSPEPADARIWKSVWTDRPLKAGSGGTVRMMGYAQPSDEHFGDRPSECQNIVKDIMWNTSIIDGCFRLPRSSWCFTYIAA